MRFGYLPLLLALGSVAQLACTVDSEDFTLTDPQLDLRVTGPCSGGATRIAGNAVPTITEDEFQEGQYSATGRITITGTDQRTATGDLKPETRVRLSFVDPDHALIAGFVSSQGLEDQSEELSFVGRTASDEIFCLAPGTVFIRATITEYSVEDPGVEPRELELVSRPFPVDCKTPLDFDRECSGLPPIDASVNEDMGVSDMGPGDELPSWSISFVPPDNESDLVIGIRGSALGRPDSVVLKFQVRDLNEATNADGAALNNLRVNFSLPENHPPNVRIEPEEGFTNAQGVASVRLIAGGTPGVVSVRARAQFGEGEAIEARSATVVIRGGIPSMRGFQFTCTDPVIPGFTRRFEANDWLFGPSHTDGTACSAQLVDRVNGRVDLATQVFFLTEAGSVDQASATDDTGIALTNLRIGPPHPFNTDPDAYEASADERFAPPPPQTSFNPRDGLVTMVAVTRGEEDFVDTDGNKIYEEGIDVLAPEHDLSEPFVDVNDNGEHDFSNREGGLIEEFRDTDRDGFFSLGNGRWDADTEIWTQTTVLWTGLFDAVASRNVVDCRIQDGCDNEAYIMPACEGIDADLFLEPGGVIRISTRFNDRNGNCLDGYGEGAVFLELDGALELPLGITDRDIDGRCFSGGVPTMPLAPTDDWLIVDRSNPDDENAVLSTITYGVDYRAVGGSTTREMVTLLVCR